MPLALGLRVEVLDGKGRRQEQSQKFWSRKTKRSRERKARGISIWDVSSGARDIGRSSCVLSSSGKLDVEFVELWRGRGLGLTLDSGSSEPAESGLLSVAGGMFETSNTSVSFCF